MRIQSICIPRLDSSLSKENLLKIFKKTDFGTPIKIIISNRKAFLYFKKINSESIVNKLYRGEDINIVYQFPFYIKCRANTNIYYLKNIHLEKELQQKTNELNTLKDDLMYVNGIANYLSANIIND